MCRLGELGEPQDFSIPTSFWFLLPSLPGQVQITHYCSIAMLHANLPALVPQWCVLGMIRFKVFQLARVKGNRLVANPPSIGAGSFRPGKTRKSFWGTAPEAGHDAKRQWAGASWHANPCGSQRCQQSSMEPGSHAPSKTPIANQINCTKLLESFILRRASTRRVVIN